MSEGAGLVRGKTIILRFALQALKLLKNEICGYFHYYREIYSCGYTVLFSSYSLSVNLSSVSF